MRRSWTPDFTNILSRRAHWTRDSDQADLHHRRSIANIQTCESNTSLKDFGSRPGDGVALTQQTCEHLRSQAWLWNRLTALLLKPELHLLRFVVDLWCCTTRYNPQQIQDKNLPKFRTQLKAHTRTHVLSASRHQLKHFCFLHLHSAPSAFDVIYSLRIRSITYLEQPASRTKSFATCTTSPRQIEVMECVPYCRHCVCTGHSSLRDRFWSNEWMPELSSQQRTIQVRLWCSHLAASKMIL